MRCNSDFGLQQTPDRWRKWTFFLCIPESNPLLLWFEIHTYIHTYNKTKYSRLHFTNKISLREPKVTWEIHKQSKKIAESDLICHYYNCVDEPKLVPLAIGIILFDKHGLILHVNQGFTLLTAILVFSCERSISISYNCVTKSNQSNSNVIIFLVPSVSSTFVFVLVH